MTLYEFAQTMTALAGIAIIQAASQILKRYLKGLQF